MSKKNQVVVENPWGFLRQFTPTRLALGRSGESIPTRELLKFQLAHAQARDAVHSAADFSRVRSELMQEPGIRCVELRSAARDRWEYLKRPDLGRQLHADSLQVLEQGEREIQEFQTRPRIAVVVGDGLSATAINHHAIPLLRLIHRCFVARNLSIGTLFLVREARVAIGDEVGEAIQAQASLVLIGERPGLSNVESIGAYLTYVPKKGRTNAERNCISNICPAGLSLEVAANQITGVALSF